MKVNTSLPSSSPPASPAASTCTTATTTPSRQSSSIDRSGRRPSGGGGGGGGSGGDCYYFKAIITCRSSWGLWTLLGLSIFQYIWQPRLLQPYAAFTTTTTTTMTATITTASSITLRQEQPGVSSLSSILLLVNHSANDFLFERIPGCRNNNNNNHNNPTTTSVCRLEFVHIPKTGGTAVELAGVVANIAWGACRFFDTVWVDAHHKTDCPDLPLHTSTPRLGPLRLKHHHYIPRGTKVNDFHLPPHYFETEPQFQGRNPYQDHHHHAAANGKNVTVHVALFAIVRDPYARVISEYYHIKTHGGVAAASSDVHNAAVMNRWLALHLTPLMKIFNATTNSSNSSSQKLDAAYYHKDGHFIPQFDYIFQDPNVGGGGVAHQAAGRSRRVVHHVLHFEHLHTDFAKLMAAYNLSFVVLPDPEHAPPPSQQHQQPAAGNNNSDSDGDGGGGGTPPVLVARKARIKKLDKYNLTLDNIRRIETIYARDFATFGYPTIRSEMEMEQQKKKTKQ